MFLDYTHTGHSSISATFALPSSPSRFSPTITSSQNVDVFTAPILFSTWLISCLSLMMEAFGNKVHSAAFDSGQKIMSDEQRKSVYHF